MNGLAGMLHLSRKAGKVLLGRTAVLSAAAAEEVVFVLAAGDCGDDLMRKLSRYDVARIVLTSSELGEIFGREKLSLIGITDEGLAAGIMDILRRDERENSGAAGQIQIKSG